MKTVGIVGAGIIGRLLALHLSRKGWQVTLFDKDTREGRESCSYAAAGMLSPLSEIEMAEALVFDMGTVSMALWESLLSTLDQPVYFKKQGTLLLSHTQDLPELLRLKDRFQSKLQHNSFIQELDNQGISMLEPALSHWQSQCFYLPLEGQIDNRMFMSALGSTLLELNVLWKEKTIVKNLRPNKIITETDEYHFDWVCDCRGLGAKENLTDLRGVRGELIYIQALEVNISRPVRFIHPRYRLYLVPRPDNIYVIGASEIESEDFSPISVRTLLELLSAAYSIHPGFAEARMIETVVNCRSAFPNNLPRLFYQQGLLRVNGLYRHGYLLAPLLAEEAVSLLENGTASLRYQELLQG